MENPIKMDDLGVPLFLETPKCQCAISWVYSFLGGGNSKEFFGMFIPKIGDMHDPI